MIRQKQREGDIHTQRERQKGREEDSSLALSLSLVFLISVCMFLTEASLSKLLTLLRIGPVSGLLSVGYIFLFLLRSVLKTKLQAAENCSRQKADYAISIQESPETKNTHETYIVYTAGFVVFCLDVQGYVYRCVATRSSVVRGSRFFAALLEFLSFTDNRQSCELLKHGC